MSQFNEAADAIRRVAKTLEGFKIAAEALESIGSVDNAAKEAQAALAKAIGERDTAIEQLALAQSTLLDVRNESASLRKEATEQAERVVLAAKAEAEAEAQRVLDQAKQQAQDIAAAAKAKVQEADDYVAKQSAEMDKLRASCEELETQVANKQVQLNALTAAMDALKAKLA